MVEEMPWSEILGCGDRNGIRVKEQIFQFGLVNDR
jgi:hypothetical protein